MEAGLMFGTGLPAVAAGAYDAVKARGTLADKLRTFAKTAGENTYSPKGKAAQDLYRTIGENLPQEAMDLLERYGQFSEENPDAAIYGETLANLMPLPNLKSMRGVIGPLYRGGVAPEHLDNGLFFTKNPEYAGEYAKGLSTEEDYYDQMTGENIPPHMSPVMGKYELDDSQLVDFRKNPELIQQYADWLAPRRLAHNQEWLGDNPAFPPSHPMMDMGRIREDILSDFMNDLPHFEHEKDVVEFLNEAKPDWTTTLFESGMDPEELPNITNLQDYGVEYRARDKSKVRNLLSDGLRKLKK